jgi:hypothetical protein
MVSFFHMQTSLIEFWMYVDNEMIKNGAYSRLKEQTLLWKNDLI